MPEVTIVTCIKTPPLFRNKEWLTRCLKSIFEQEEKVKSILVDYGSEDAQKSWIREVAKRYDTEILETYKENANFGTALNVGIKRSDTKYTAMMGADTRLKPTAIKRVLEVMKRSKGWYITGLASITDANGNVSGSDKKNDKGSFIITSTKWLHKVHGFDERLKGWGCDDGDLYLRAMRDGLRHEWLCEQVLVENHDMFNGKERGKEAKRNASIVDNDKSIIRNLKTWGEY